MVAMLFVLPLQWCLQVPHTLMLCRFVKDKEGKGGKVVKLTGSLDAKSR